MANLNTKTIADGVGDILAVDGGVTGSGKNVKDGAGNLTPLWLTTTKLGIGASTPSALLHLKSTASAQVALLLESTADQEATLQVKNSQGGGWEFKADNGADKLSISEVGDATRMTILAGGKVGIGTASPGYGLDISGAGTLGQLRVYSTDADGTIRIDTANEDHSSTLSFESGLNSKGIIYYDHHVDAPAQTMNFKVGDNAIHAMTILGDGNVGIGETNPDSPLEIGGTATQMAHIRSSFAGNVALRMERDSNTIMDVVAGASSFGGGLLSSTELRFCVNGDAITAPSMVIDTNNYVGIGTTAPTATLHVSKELANDATLVHFEYHTADNAVDANDTIMRLEFGDDNSEAGTPYFMTFQDSDSVMAHIKWDDDNSTVFTDVSDYRIKSNIELMGGSLADINKLKPSSFNIKQATKKAYGFIAHELAEVYPFMVGGEKDAVDDDGEKVLQSVAYSKLLPFMIKAIQELSAKVTALENA